MRERYRFVAGMLYAIPLSVLLWIIIIGIALLVARR